MGLNKLCLVDKNIFDWLDKNRIHQWHVTKSNKSAKMKNHYSNERKVHHLKDSIIHWLDENQYSSIGWKYN